MNQIDKNCPKNMVLVGNQCVWSTNSECVPSMKNTKYVTPLNVLDSQPTIKHPYMHLPNQQSQSLTSTSSLSGNSTTSNSINSHASASPLENLPKKFVSSMRTLFDIMDDKRTGFVRLVDIEARWQDDGSKGLPHGVIDCLRRVTPVSGMLSFERFCAGLKICLLRNQANECELGRRISTDSYCNNNNNKLITIYNQSEKTINTKNTINNHNTNICNQINGKNVIDEKIQSNKCVLPNFDNDQFDANKIRYMKNSHIQEDKKAAKIYKRSSLAAQRTLSLPKLSPSSDGDSSSEVPCVMPIVLSVLAPPKPPRTALMANNDAINDPKERFDKAEIRNALQNWQMNVLMNEWEAKDKRRALAVPNSVFINRGTADGSSNTMINQKVPLQAQMTVQHSQSNTNSMKHTVQKPIQTIYPTNRSPTLLEFQKKTNRRRETRRHTLQNGIDYNILKRIRHLEEEKDLLLDGLHAVENTQEWYFKQIALVQEKMKSLSRGDTHLEQWSEAYDERIDLQRTRIMEVNRCLASLENSWERGGLPMHMNLAVRTHNYAYNNNSINNNNNSSNNNNNNSNIAQFHDIQLNQLKTQNHQLTEEVSQKSKRITALELERNTLIREIVQHQQQQQQQFLSKQICGNEEVIF